MKIFNSKTKIFLILIFFTFYFLFSTFFTNAQSSEFLTSWQVKSYVPNWYQGKIFPTKGSNVKVNFELLEGGKIIDLSKYKIRWYLNDKLRINEQNGLGIKSFSFIVSNYPNQDAEVRIVIVNYKGGGELSKTINIPIVSPEVVIDSPYADKKISQGTNYLKSYPFFFTNSDFSKFSFKWAVGGQSTEDSGNLSRNELKLTIDQKAPSGFDVDISVMVNNLLDEMQFASKGIQLQIK